MLDHDLVELDSLFWRWNQKFQEIAVGALWDAFEGKIRGDEENTAESRWQERDLFCSLSCHISLDHSNQNGAWSLCIHILPQKKLNRGAGMEQIRS
jgi:hypothetical protein